MTLSDFLAASQGDERLAWARFLYWHGCRTNPKYPYRQSDAWAAVFAKKEAETLCNHKSETGVDHLSIADAVLAELAGQREADKARIEELTIENQRLELQVTELIWQS